jgi:mono/diheme cytochrome c family protein
VLILPLLLVKVAIVRLYPGLSRMLPGLGVAVFSLAVTVIFMGAMPYAIAKASAPDTEDLSPEDLVVVGGKLMEQRCQKCHDLDRVYDQKGRKSSDLWEVTMDAMVRLEPPLADVRDPILAFLQAEFSAPDTPEGVMLTGAALVEARCQKCHNIDRVFSETKTLEHWDLTVKRYAELLPDHIKPEEIAPIVQFLFEKRGAPPDPDADKRKLFEQHCGRCHNLSRSLDKATEDELSPRRWKRIVKKMRRVAEERELGDLWTPEEATTIAEYLAAQFQPADQD